MPNLVVRALIVGLLASLALALVPGEASAAPANDNWASATVISGASGTSVGTNVLATIETLEPFSATIDYGNEGPYHTAGTGGRPRPPQRRRSTCVPRRPSTPSCPSTPVRGRSAP